MRLQYHLTLADYQEGHAAAARASPIIYFGSWFTACILLIVGVANIAIASPFRVQSFIAMGVGAWMLGELTVLGRWGVLRAWKRESRLHEPIVIEVMRDGLGFPAPDSQFYIEWRAYTHFVETENLLVLHHPKEGSFLVPKRAFADEVQAQQFRGLLCNIAAPVPKL